MDTLKFHFFLGYGEQKCFHPLAVKIVNELLKLDHKLTTLIKRDFHRAHRTTFTNLLHFL